MMLIAKNSQELNLLPQMSNRHGLIAGATGTGKTVTLQSIAEQFSLIGVPVFLADVKGDLAGISQPGGNNPKISERIQSLGIPGHTFEAFPVALWDVFGKSGHPIRASVSEMGPLLFARLLNLNDVQAGVLNIVFKIADDNGMLLLDLKDIRSMVQYVGDNASEFTTSYGNLSKASIGAIQRGLMELESQGADQFFGEPCLDIFDLMQTSSNGRGMINILAADQLYLKPKTYATFLLWLLSELFEQLPEVGDLSKPKLVFFFDEAHLLFEDAPDALMEKIEQVVRLIRSKGVGIFFVTQNPLDIPEKVLAQLGNRVQHALRAFTPNDQKAIKAMARTFRPNPSINIETTLIDLGVGEALVSVLDEKGSPSIVERAFICPGRSRAGAVTADERQIVIKESIHYGNYEKTVDRESAFEVLKKRTEERMAQQEQAAQQTAMSRQPKAMDMRTVRRPGRPSDDLMTTVAKSAARSIGSSVGRQIIRGVLGSIFGGSSRRR
ncbi:MAG: DUF853 domain-containing protein [Candidatus Omnitrophica bacterium]|nr:DUF853 domain-containing protein [Candidatus Omnitrophota bacterium]